MSRLVESINIFEGQIDQLSFHEDRANASRMAIYGELLPPLNLLDAVRVPTDMKSGSVKCRVLYDSVIRSITYQPYQIKEINTVKIVHDNSISYPYKWEERTALDELFASRGKSDEILIFKNGLLTDAYYYNIVVCINGDYITPRLPLLAGTRRKQLLEGGWITEADIDQFLLRKATAIFLINAMTMMGKIRLSMKQIVF